VKQLFLMEKNQINNDKKPHRRWLLFRDYINFGKIINFEHIKGSDNMFVDILSKYIIQK